MSIPIVKAGAANGVKWLVLVHTTGIFSKYKAAGEWYRQIEKKIDEIIKGKDIALTILRPTMIYGTLNDKNVSVFIKMVDKMRVFPVVNGAKYNLQPVWCGDLGKAYYQVLMNYEITKNKNYNLSGAEPIMLIDMFRHMEKELGVKNRYITVPFSLAYAGAYLLYLISFRKYDYREKVQRLVEERVFDHNAATNDFGYAPLSFEDGITEEIKEYKKAVGK